LDSAFELSALEFGVGVKGLTGASSVLMGFSFLGLENRGYAERVKGTDQWGNGLNCSAIKAQLSQNKSIESPTS
jgi:hypothetical protein